MYLPSGYSYSVFDWTEWALIKERDFDVLSDGIWSSIATRSERFHDFDGYINPLERSGYWILLGLELKCLLANTVCPDVQHGY